MTSGRRQTYWSHDGENYRKRRHAAYTWPIILALLLIASSLAVIYFLYTYDTQEAQKKVNGFPLIEATHPLIKEVPADPGGEDIPHQDKLVFSAISEEEPLSSLGAQYQAQALRQEPEAPMETKHLSFMEEVEESIEKVEEKISKKEKDTIEAQEKDTPTKVTENKKTETKEIFSKNQKNPKLKEKPTSKEKSFPYTLQTSAMYTSKAAEKEWEIQKTDSSFLTDKTSYAICPKEVSGYGTLYKLYVGQYTSEEKANAFCKKLKKDLVDCFVAKTPEDQTSCTKKFL